jgi:hypothetical protein
MQPILRSALAKTALASIALTCALADRATAQSVLPRPDFRFPGTVGRTYLDSDPPQFPQPGQAPKGAPNAPFEEPQTGAMRGIDASQRNGHEIAVLEQDRVPVIHVARVEPVEIVKAQAVGPPIEWSGSSCCAERMTIIAAKEPGNLKIGENKISTSTSQF